MHHIRPGREIFGHHQWGVFDLFGQLPPGLIVDAGAAAGYVSKYLLSKSPGSRALAFEPFPGNWVFAEKNLAGCNATLIKAALAEKAGEMPFYVGSTAHAKGQWKDMKGYSSVGHIVKEDQTRDASKTIIVPVTTVDENVDERIRFLKIDVQGGELEVLKGAAESFDRGVDMAYIEFSGEIEILRFLLDRAYVIFDHQYLLVPTSGQPAENRWSIAKDFTLSTGHAAHYAWPAATPADPVEFCEFFATEAAKIGQVYTDIVAVRPEIARGLGWLIDG